MGLLTPIYGDGIYDELKETYTRYDDAQQRCRDCAYLVEGDCGAWVCDDRQKDIHEVSDDDCAVCNIGEDMVWCAEYGGYLLDYVTIEPYGGEPCRYLLEDDADESSGVWLYIGDRLVSNNCFAAGALLDDCIEVLRDDAKVVRACDRFCTDIEYIAKEYADEI